MNNTSIKWTEKTWNPVTGCEKISAGCQHCYAHRIATNPWFSKIFPNGFNLTLHPERFVQPFDIKKPALIFVNSMSDLFWDQVPQWMVDCVFEVIEATPRHTYQILTKRPERMLTQSLSRPFPKNVWAGVTIENQAQAGRMDYLREVKAHTKFLSCEPLLSPLDLDWKAVDWVITGGESGPHLNDPVKCAKRGLVEKVGGVWMPRNDRLDWIRQIRDGCHAVDTAFYHKQWGGPKPDIGNNVLDGQSWEQFPEFLTSKPIVPSMTTKPTKVEITGSRTDQQLIMRLLQP